MPNVKCSICKKEFYTKPSHQKLGWGKYCSRECMHQGQRKGTWILCDICGKKAWKMPKDLKGSKSGKFFCNKSCSTLWRNKFFSGPKHPNWVNGEFTYQRIMRDHGIKPICTECSISDKRVLIIHHKDQNRTNNNIKNLVWLCRNCHYIEHSHKQ